MTRDEIRALQTLLRREGFDPGPIDGILGPRTRDAMLARDRAREVGAAHKAIVRGARIDPPAGVVWRNWHDPDVKPLRSSPGVGSPDQIILHESVTTTWQRAVDVLLRRHLSTHLVVHRDGVVSQHADLTDKCVHARGYNHRSIAIEIVNRYYSDRDDTTPGIEAIWAHRGWYELPTPEQVEAVWLVVQWLCTGGIWPPLTFPALDGDTFVWGRAKTGAAQAGVLAHARSDHADGLVPECYCVLRARGFVPTMAWRVAIDLASSGMRRTDLPRVAGSHRDR